MSEIKPALTARGWADWFGYGEETRRDKLDWAYGEINGIDGNGDHELAALALHGQSFGFTWDDVDQLRWCASEWETHTNPGEPHLLSLADRIAALLPPRESA